MYITGSGLSINNRDPLFDAHLVHLQTSPTTMMKSRTFSCSRTTPIVRFYLLLSWLVVGYYISFVNSEGRAEFTTALSAEASASELLYKQLNNLKSCPVVKLPGMAGSNKKARHMNRFVALICWNLLCVVQTLSSLEAFIDNKLQRAGDVESNPGPPPPPVSVEPAEGRSSTTVPNDVDTTQIDVGDIPHMPHGQTHPYQPTVSPDVPRTDRRVNEPITSQSITPVEELQQFLGARDGTHSAESLVDLGRPSSPQGQEALQNAVEDQSEANRRIRRLGNEQHSREDVQSTTSQSIQRSTQPTHDDEQGSVAVSQLGAEYPLRRQSLPPTLSGASASHKQTLARKRIREGQQEKVLELHRRLSNMEELEQKGEVPTRLMEFFIGANKLYRSGDKCPVCPTCLKLKKNRRMQRKSEVKEDEGEQQSSKPKKKKGKSQQQGGGNQKSHVIPKCILALYGEIHNTDKQTNYILDLSRNEMLAPGGLTYQLLCERCEKYYSTMEQLLANVYLYIVANPNMDFIIVHEDSQPTSWLKYILANILLRGILTNIDLDERFQDKHIMDEVYSLWKLCSETLNATCTPQNDCPNLKIFLLPNKPFNEHRFMYPFEMLLRMPHSADLIKRSEMLFFYTKFDSFHIVLPLCKKSRDYFDTFNNGVREDGPNLHLRQVVLQKAELNFCQQNKSMDIKYPPRCATLKNHFPEVLLEWCASLYETIVSRLYNHPRSLNPFLAVIERYDGAQYVGFGTEDRLKLIDTLKIHFVDERASRTTAYEDHSKLRKSDQDKYISEASKNSPLRRLEIEMLRDKVQSCEQEMKTKDAELVATKRDLGDTRMELGNSRQKVEDQNKELKQASATIDRQKESIECVHSELLSSRAELQYSRDENDDLKEKLDTETSHRQRLQSISKAQCQTNVEEFEMIKFRYMSSLRHHQPSVYENLKEKLFVLVTRFKQLALLTKAVDPELHQTYSNLQEECNKLLNK